MLISHWLRLRFLLAVSPCDRTVNSFPKWYDTKNRPKNEGMRAISLIW